MKTRPTPGPQHSLFFRWIAIFARMRLKYLHTKSGHRELIGALYLFMAGVTALGTITILAYLSDFMLLFPPLGPSAFILFYTPLAESASPRNLIMGHGVALLSGLGALAIAQFLFPELSDPAYVAMNWSHVTAVVLAMGASSMAMIALGCVHPPATATALIAAMGYLDNLVQTGGVLVAVLFLAVEAYLFNRIWGGLPYPLWRSKPDIDKMYRSLGDRSTVKRSRWEKIAEKTFERR